MAGKIFINYRRGDDAGFTQALYMRLEDEFAAGDLFMDVEGHIKPGDDFVDVLNRQVAQCDVLLAIIGPRWADLMSERRDDKDDFVAIEIKAALDQGKRVIPVLVGGAAVPRADTLPESIRALARRNAVGLRPERFKADCQGLVTALKESLAAAVQERAARTDAERRAAEAARREEEAQAAARARASEERGRAQAAAGLSAEEIRKAEELASWDFVKERGIIQDLRDHLARFPGGTTERYALAKLDGLVWAALGSEPAFEQVRAYLDEFPKGEHSAAARSLVIKLEQAAEAGRAAAERARAETEAWAAASSADTKDAYQSYLNTWPSAEHADAAKVRLRELTRGPGRRRWALAVGAVGGLLGLWGLYTNAANIVDAVRPLPAFAEPEMVNVPAGEFMMGSNDGRDNEKPVHKVKIAEPFAVGKYEVTFDEWDICVKEGGCKESPSASNWGRGRRPVIKVSWDDAKEYVAWLSRKTGQPYRLLTEAEWEYAARAGSAGRWSFGDDEAKLGEYAWYYDNSGSETHPVGQKQPNAFGIYDMHGNVWEWVEDCYKDSYAWAPGDGSASTSGDCSRRVLRGGSWDIGPEDLRSAYRNWDAADFRGDDLGFRVGRTLTP